MFLTMFQSPRLSEDADVLLEQNFVSRPQWSEGGLQG